MIRDRRIALISHCVLNQNAVLTDWGRAKGPFTTLVCSMMNQNLGLLQLPCPEMMYLGVNRPPQNYADYNTPAFREHCRNLLAPPLAELNKLVEDGCTLELLLGIENSPCCDLHTGKGVFMEELFCMLPEGILPVVRQMVPENYHEEKCIVPLIIL